MHFILTLIYIYFQTSIYKVQIYFPSLIFYHAIYFATSKFIFHLDYFTGKLHFICPDVFFAFLCVLCVLITFMCPCPCMYVCPCPWWIIRVYLFFILTFDIILQRADLFSISIFYRLYNYFPCWHNFTARLFIFHLH